MKTHWAFSYGFFGLGSAMLVGALVWALSVQSFRDRAATAQGTVIELVPGTTRKSTHTFFPVVRFATASGQRVVFTSHVGSSLPVYAKGDRVEVLYLPSDPQNARIDAFANLWIGPLIVGALGSVFFLVGSGFLLAPVIRARRDARLVTQGRRIETRLQSVAIDERLKGQGRQPFRIVSQWHDPVGGKMHVFESPDLYFDPSDYVKDRPITVFVDPDDPRKYHMDLSFLPKLAD